MKAKVEIEMTLNEQALECCGAPSQIIADMFAGSDYFNVKTVKVNYEPIPVNNDNGSNDQLESLVGQMSKALDEVNLSVALLRMDIGFTQPMAITYSQLGEFNKAINQLRPGLNKLTQSLKMLEACDLKGILKTNPTEYIKNNLGGH